MSADEIKNRTVYMLCRTDKPGDGTDIYYIGSSSHPLKERLRCHKKDAQRPRNENNRLYVRMLRIGLKNWKIILLVTFSCDQKTIFEFERDWIQILRADLNMIFPITDRKKYKADYHQNNRDAILKRQAGYRMANRDILLKKDKEYRKNNVEAKKYHCIVCDISFGYKKDLNKHFDTLKHPYAYMNSVD